MVFPNPWWDVNQAGWFWTESGGDNHMGCGVLDLPEDTEFMEHEAGSSTTTAHDCMKFWFSNGVEIPGHATIPDYMSQADVTCTGQAGHHHGQKFPWNAPGTAQPFGPCGTLGGIPLGCHNDGSGNFGDCCSDHCDGFALGENAEDYHWKNAPVTEWKAGSSQEVAWYCGANHAGGYSYRLCKTPHGGISHLTEECFQQNHLDFVADEQWVQYGKDRKTGHRTELKALQTTEGTYPDGSMWRANPLVPHMEENGSSDYGHGHIIDNVEVPQNMDAGDYVLSFRWDSKCSPQVWGACANIRIV
eukprot:GFUD01043114.1.p1 GENE.GFUD01043114.1~~GFUD01043114.1.p1  ORF type:complete len:331 (+),score=71.79 GFUD01043114.1:90-995(+)